MIYNSYTPKKNPSHISELKSFYVTLHQKKTLKKNMSSLLSSPTSYNIGAMTFSPNL